MASSASCCGARVSPDLLFPDPVDSSAIVTHPLASTGGAVRCFLTFGLRVGASVRMGRDDKSDISSVKCRPRDTSSRQRWTAGEAGQVHGQTAASVRCFVDSRSHPDERTTLFGPSNEHDNLHHSRHWRKQGTGIGVCQAVDQAKTSSQSNHRNVPGSGKSTGQEMFSISCRRIFFRRN